MVKRALACLALLAAFGAPAKAADSATDNPFNGQWSSEGYQPENIMIFRVEGYDQSNGPFGTFVGQFQWFQGTEGGGGRMEFKGRTSRDA